MHRPAVSYQFDDVVLNPETFSVEKSGRVLALEPKSIRLLLYLIQNRSRSICKEELLSNIWEDVMVSDNALTRVVAQLRKALGDNLAAPLCRNRSDYEPHSGSMPRPSLTALRCRLLLL
jgi:DNA-binding winged helix-turn-helix (wHTH) protein